MERKNKNNRHGIAIQYTRQDMTRLSPRNITRQNDTIDRVQDCKPSHATTRRNKTRLHRRQNFSKKQNSNLMCTEFDQSWT